MRSPGWNLCSRQSPALATSTRKAESSPKSNSLVLPSLIVDPAHVRVPRPCLSSSLRVARVLAGPQSGRVVSTFSHSKDLGIGVNRHASPSLFPLQSRVCPPPERVLPVQIMGWAWELQGYVGVGLLREPKLDVFLYGACLNPDSSCPLLV